MAKKAVVKPVSRNGNGKKDILGQKPFIKGYNNNMIYVAGTLIAGLYAYSQGWLSSILGGAAPTLGPASVSANPNPAQEGQVVTAVGSFNPSVPNAYWGVFNSQNQLIQSGSLGNNVGSFSQSLGTYPRGNYTVEVSDQQIQGATGTGQQPVLAINQQLASNWTPTIATQQVGGAFGAAPQAGPENLTLG